MNIEVEKSKRLITKHYANIKKIQSECLHPKETLDKVHKGNTGNYDPGDNSYWIEFRCQECDKFWIEDQ